MGMSIDEAIKHCEEVAEEKEGEAQDLEYSKLDWRYEAEQCSECAKEYRQLAEWLKDYKRLKEQEQYYKDLTESYERTINKLTKAIAEQEPTTENDLGVENDLVSSIVEKISEKVTETHEEFIFETIRPYCEDVVQMKISKRDLEQALLKYYGKNNLEVDCVARQDVERFIEGFINEYTPEEELEFINLELDGLKHIPPVTPQEPRWIHVSERLPEKTGWYLITFRTYGGSYAVSDMCYRKPENYWTRDNICKKVLDNDEVVAWMPLPEAYNEVEA